MKKKVKEVIIESLSSKGLGVARLENGNKVEVPFTMPGDKVKALILNRGRSLLEEIVEPASARIPGKCIHFGSCGGCLWQEIPYEMQVAEKERRIEALFGEKVTMIRAENPWEYRNKMEFTFSQDKEGNRYLGLIMRGSKGKAIELTECHICHPWFAQKVIEVRKWWAETSLLAYFPPGDRGALRTLTLRRGVNTGETMAILTVSGNPDYAIPKADIESFAALFDEGSVFLRVQQLVKGKETQFYEMHLKGPEHVREKLSVFSKEYEFKISPMAFFQPNTKQAEKLYEKALDMAELTGEERVVDLYCGTGTLTLLAASRAKHAVGVELILDAIYDGRENAEINGIRNVEFIKGDVGEVIESGKVGSADVVVVDPPRVGLDAKAIEQIAKLEPKIIVYISCNPKTQAENVAALIEKGYRIDGICPVDQFPHTVHMENIVKLVRVS